MGTEIRLPAARRGGPFRHALALLLLFAFALQSYLVQTHIHGTSEAGSQVCAAAACVTHTSHQRSPLGDAAADCPLCQAIVHAGVFFAPAAVAVFVPRMWVEGALISAKSIAARGQFSRNGLSRAPPR